MSPKRMFHPVTLGWRDSGHLVIIIGGVAYRTLNSFDAFRAINVTAERMNTAIARGHQLLESNSNDLPEFTKEGTLDQIEEALRNPTMAILALDPVNEKIEDSITVHNHPSHSLHKEIEIPDSQEYIAAIGSGEDSDSDMGSDTTTKPTTKSTRKTPLPTTTLEEDAL
ncbi:hypothetical protein BGX38DRAFT_1278197 [Terfezia claveryi]|nr:hypothetical protein BGX38DRAFT_1278197 [Terfezia claveryi]